MPCQFEREPLSNRGTLWFHKGAQIVTQKTKVNGNIVMFDSGNLMIGVIFPNVTATVSLAGLPFENPDDHVQAIQVLAFHNHKSGG